MVSPSPDASGALVAATPAKTALEALHAWTAGHRLGTKPSTDTAPTLLITSDDTFASRELVRDEFASRFPPASPVPGTGRTLSSPRPWRASSPASSPTLNIPTTKEKS
jgi:hypothetical protein